MEHFAKQRSLVRRPWVWAVAVLLIVLIPRLLTLIFAVAPARDAIRYWSAADLFYTQPFLSALRGADSYPIYPLSLATLKWIGLANTPEMWWRSSQLLSLACYVTFLWFSYLVGRRLFGSRIACWGIVLVSILPRQIRYSVDVLSDNLGVALSMASLWMLLRAIDQPHSVRQVIQFMIAGLVLGLASLTRIQSLIIPLAVIWAFVVWFTFHSRRIAWAVPFQATAYLLPIVLMVGGYIAARGELSPRNTARAILSQQTMLERDPAAKPVEWKTPVDAWMPITSGLHGSAWIRATAGGWTVSSLRALWEFLQETRGVLGLFFFVGLVVWFREPQSSSSKSIVLWLIVGSFALVVLCRWRAGFVAGRYFLLVLPLCAMIAAKGIQSLLEAIHRRSIPRNRHTPWIDLSLARGVALGLGALLIGVSVPAWMERLHADRFGHRAAADWLLAHTRDGEAVFDPSWVSAYFSGRPMASLTPGIPTQTRYAVIDRSLSAAPPNGTAPAIRFAESGRVVAEFPKRAGSQTIGIRIIELPHHSLGSTRQMGN
ncbi:glycosyltransferase family 39 protein [bacterium]|nr:glycosyltransferase family 39 protein [bacterium]